MTYWGHMTLLSVLAVALLGVASARGEAQTNTAQAEVARIQGKVQVLRKGQTKWIPATVGMKITEGDQVRAGARSTAEVKMADRSRLVLAEKTRLAISEFRYEPETRARRAHIRIHDEFGDLDYAIPREKEKIQ